MHFLFSTGMFGLEFYTNLPASILLICRSQILFPCCTPSSISWIPLCCLRSSFPTLTCNVFPCFYTVSFLSVLMFKMHLLFDIWHFSVRFRRLLQSTLINFSFTSHRQTILNIWYVSVLIFMFNCLAWILNARSGLWRLLQQSAAFVRCSIILFPIELNQSTERVPSFSCTLFLQL